MSSSACSVAKIKSFKLQAPEELTEDQKEGMNNNAYCGRNTRLLQWKTAYQPLSFSVCLYLGQNISDAGRPTLQLH